MSSIGVKLSIVLPCYNEADSLPMLLARYCDVWEDLPSELILVNNGSTDNTAEVLQRELSRPELPFVRTVLVHKNQGYGHGIYTGLKAAKGEFLGFSHADMQCNPADLFKAYHLLSAHPDPTRAIVKGNRAWRGFGPWLQTAAMGVIASTVLFPGLRDINAQPKVFHHSHLKHLEHPPIGFEFDLYTLYKARQYGLKILNVPVVFAPRVYGTSKWAFSLLSRYKTILAMIGYIFRLRFYRDRRN